MKKNDRIKENSSLGGGENKINEKEPFQNQTQLRVRKNILKHMDRLSEDNMYILLSCAHDLLWTQQEKIRMEQKFIKSLDEQETKHLMQSRRATKTPLLSELYFTCREKYSQYFTDVTENKRLALVESDIETGIKDFLNQEQILKMQDKIGWLECECLYMGFIDGFKMAKKLIEELETAYDPDFLKEILLQDDELKAIEDSINAKN